MKARGVRGNRHLRDRLLYRGKQHTCRVSQGSTAMTGEAKSEVPTVYPRKNHRKTMENHRKMVVDWDLTDDVPSGND